MNTFWMIFALVVVIATGRMLIKPPRSRPAVQKAKGSRQLGRRASDSSRTIAPFPLLARSDPFDDRGRLIWRTQIPAFKTVCDHAPNSIPCAELRPIYVDLARSYPEIYEGHSFRDWGQLFVDLDLFRVESQSVYVTEAGRALYQLLVTGTSGPVRNSTPQWVAHLRF